MTDNEKIISKEGGYSIGGAVAATQDEIRRLLRGAPVPIRRMTTHLSRSTGKMIRARALLAAAIDKKGEIAPDAVCAAASIELIHLASLVHDDIIDRADKRRGAETLHIKFGEKYAVLCGDYLLAVALELAAGIKPPASRKPDNRTLPHYISEVCVGELMQNQNNGNFKLTERQYFRTIRGKTAALFEASFYSGFMFSDEDDSFCAAYQEAGGNIGLIFQLADDISDYTASSKETKKPVLSDYRSGVVTLPLIYALKNEPALADRVASGDITPEELREAIIVAGGLDYAYAKIRKLRRKTEALIRSLDICAEKSALLLDLLAISCGEKT